MLIVVAIAAVVVGTHAPALAREAASPPAADSGVIRVKSGYEMSRSNGNVR